MPGADPEPPAPAAAPALELLLERDVPPAADGADAVPDHAFLHGWAAHALGATFPDSPPPARAELSTRLVDEATMRALNREWRGRDAPTNVLSFPAGLPPLDDGDGALLVLGDLVLCPAVVAAEARARGVPAADHWAHLVVHGVLHLRGHDHESDAEAHAMESLETRLLAARGLPDPYAEPVPET